MEAQQNDDIDIDEAVEAAMKDTAAVPDEPVTDEQPQKGPSAKEQAAAEEAAAAQRYAQAKADEEASTVRSTPVIEQGEDLGSIAAQGMEYLHRKLREHANKPKLVYTPPPITESMAERIREEQEAGKRAVAKHAAQQASRPQPPRDPKEGFTNPVYRPGDVVPDPALPAGASAAGTRKFSAEA